jgi:hypothetical protein
MSEISSSARITGAVFCVALFEADAPPASDKAPAMPNAVTTLLRPLPFKVCFERDIVSDLHFGPEPRPKYSLALPCAPYKHYLCFNSSRSLAKFAAIEATRPDRQRLFASGALRQAD